MFFTVELTVGIVECEVSHLLTAAGISSSGSSRRR